jgi:hypothetical protein
MRTTPISYIGLFILFLSFAITSCNKAVKKFNIREYSPIVANYDAYFNKKDIIVLKKQWGEFYSFLKKGHIQKGTWKSEDVYVFSFDLYKFLQANLLKFYTTPFLEDYESFAKIFGKPEYFHDDGERIEIVYTRSIIGDSCKTCTHHGIGFKFDAKTKKLVKN